MVFRWVIYSQGDSLLRKVFWLLTVPCSVHVYVAKKCTTARKRGALLARESNIVARSFKWEKSHQIVPWRQITNTVTTLMGKRKPVWHCRSGGGFLLLVLDVCTIHTTSFGPTGDSRLRRRRGRGRGSKADWKKPARDESIETTRTESNREKKHSLWNLTPY